jgi:peroxiredoxin
MDLGDSAPDFSLPGTDGKTYQLADFKGKKALVVIFSCNHCPYVKATEGRMIELQAKYGPQGAQLLAINANDAVGYPEDSFEAMKKNAQAKGFNFPYLRDETQAVAKAYGATHTPHIFLFSQDGKLAYTGKIDDNWEHPEKVTRRYLADALDALLAGHSVPEPQTHSIGCTIKWKR